jgi:hypothetical protein
MTAHEDEIARLNAVMALVGTTAQGLSIVMGGGPSETKNTAVQSVLNLLSAAAFAGESALPAFESLATQVRAMAEAGREPTVGEWISLHERSLAAHNALMES